MLFGLSDMFSTALPPVLHSLYVCAGVPPSLANPCNQGLRNSSGSLAILVVIRRASSSLSSLAVADSAVETFVIGASRYLRCVLFY